MIRRILVAGLILLGMLLFPLLVKTVLAALAVQEMPLNPLGAPYEIHADSLGNLWVSDYDAGEIWQVNAAGTSYTSYSVGGNPSDASPDNQGGVWWVDATSINRLNIATDGTQSWDVAGSGWLYGLAVDSLGRVWMADSDFSLPNVYRFNPADRELCTFPLPNGGQGYYPAASGSQVWLGDGVNGRLLRLDSAQIDWWDLPADSFPQDVDIDATGNVWYADSNLTQIGRLVPGTGVLTVFGVPVGYSPAMLSTSAGKVWYTENVQATVGLLDPLVAAGSSQTATSGSLSITPGCITLANPATGKAKTTPGTPVWSAASYSTLSDAGGWRIYQLPVDSSPAGIAVTDLAWMVDAGRRALVKLPFSKLSLAAEKIPDLASVPETGGDVTFTFKVTNNSGAVSLNITSLGDSIYGSLAGDGDCQVGTSLSAGASCDFAITRWVEGNFSGPSHTNTFTVRAEDPLNFSAEATAQATVSFTNVVPSIQITKTANPTAVPETGGYVTFTFSVLNTSSEEPVSITELSDSMYGTLNGDGDCTVGTQLSAGASCEFAITRWVVVPYGGPDHTNVFTAKAADDDGSVATGLESESVTYAMEPPSIAVTKTANPTSVPESGGEVVFTFNIQNTNTREPATINSLSDTVYGTLSGSDACRVGTILSPGASCQFSITRLVSGSASGPAHHNTFTTVVRDDENNSASASDDATVTFTSEQASWYVYLPLLIK